MVRLCIWWWAFMYTVVWSSLSSFECDLAQLCSQFSLPLRFLDLKKKVSSSIFQWALYNPPMSVWQLWKSESTALFLSPTLVKRTGAYMCACPSFSLVFLVCSSVFLCWCALFFHSLDDSLWHSEVLNQNSFICGWVLLSGLSLHPQVLVPSILFMSEV